MGKFCPSHISSDSERLSFSDNVDLRSNCERKANPNFVTRLCDHILEGADQKLSYVLW